MHILVLSACTSTYLPLAKITQPTKTRYAGIHGYACECRVSPEAGTSWGRVRIWLKALEEVGENGVVFFTGTDAAITNPVTSVESLLRYNADFRFCVDQHGLQCDSWVMVSNTRTRAFLEAVLAREGKDNNEQDAMQVVLSGAASYGDLRRRYDMGGEDRWLFFTRELNNTPVKCQLTDRRVLNALPHEHYGGTGEEPYSWCPLSLVCHFPGKSLDFRLTHFPAYIEKGAAAYERR